MSDIAIRFDGLILAGALLVATSIFLLVALGAAIAAMLNRPSRKRLLAAARIALLYALLNGAGLAATFTYMAYRSPPAGPDWIDWLALPVMLLLTAGCVALVRRKSTLQQQA